MKKCRVLRVAIMLLLFSFINANATVWYVHPDSTLNSIQGGIDSSSTGDTVLVAEGTYFENINWPNTQGINLISELGPELSIINGDSAGSVITCTTGVDTTTLIKGFTFANGYSSFGCGIDCRSSSPSLSNVTISGNNAEHEGGGIYCTWSSLSLKNVTISGNNAGLGGGGIFCVSSNPSFTNVTISGNTASSGGGIMCDVGSSPSLTNVTIIGNTAYWVGGGIYCYSCSLSLSNVIISENYVVHDGGGIFCTWSSLSLTNVTISGNNADSLGGGIYCSVGSSLNLMNCILWNDIPDEIDTISGAIVTATYSDIQGGWSGTGNIDEDPVFVSGSLSDYHLCPSTPSPCIDAGNPDAQYNDPEDPLIPGYAMWPALGTIRNDMGVYGGPGTEVWTGVEEEEIYDEDVFILSKAYQNLFMDKTHIEYNLPKISNVNISVYNVLGSRVRILLNKRQNIGIHTITWDGRDERGNKVPSGFYFLRLEAGEYKGTRKLLLLR